MILPGSLRMLAVMAALGGAAFQAAHAAAAAPQMSFHGLNGVWEQPNAMTFSNPRTQAERDRVRPATAMVFQPVLPEFTPEYAEIWRQRFQSQLAGKTIADPTANCVPPGLPRIMLAPFPIQIVEAPDQVLIIAEYMSQVRRIYTDGRAHPADPDPTFNGHSVGHWEGDTLVIDTVGLRADTAVDVTLIPHSDQLHVVERIRRVGDALEVDTSLHDPKAFVRPWTTTKTYRLMPGAEILEYACAENNRNFSDDEGITTLR